MTDVVFVTVVALRLLVPLAIPKFPLPAILAALVLDAADQTIFQAVHATSILDEYQGYDKALDVYYLTIAYTATLRNWLDPFAEGVARFLFYYRLAGTLTFELTGARWVLLVFPNTFEYFFIAYEAVRLLWNPAKMPHRLVLGLAAFVWVFIKLPQEWWLHIAELDVTEQQGMHPWLLPVFFGSLALIALVGWKAFGARVPVPTRKPDVDVDRYIDRPRSAAVAPRRDMAAIFSMAVLEKVVLLGTVAVIFSQVLEGVRASDLQVVAGVAAVVLLNSVVSLWTFEHGTRYGSTLAQVVAMALTNLAILAVGILLRRTAGVDAYLDVQDALFYLLLLSLIIAVYDRYRVVGNLSTDRRPRRRTLRRRPRPVSSVAL